MSLKGRPRKPVEVLEANGAFEKNPQRRRDPPPKSNHPAGDPPEYLNAVEKQIWHELVMDIPMGVATAPDRGALGCLCMLEYLKRNRNIKVIELNVLIKLYSLFGLTPADRTRVTAAPLEKDDDPLDEFH